MKKTNSNSEESASTEEKNLAIINGMFYQFWEKLDISLIDTYFTKNFEIELNGKNYPYEEFKNFVTDYLANVKSIKITCHDILAVSNKVVARSTLDYIYKDGKKSQDYEIFIAEIQGDKIARMWELYTSSN